VRSISNAENLWLLQLCNPDTLSTVTIYKKFWKCLLSGGRNSGILYWIIIVGGEGDPFLPIFNICGKESDKWAYSILKNDEMKMMANRVNLRSNMGPKPHESLVFRTTCAESI
jgi:hypothetical protein